MKNENIIFNFPIGEILEKFKPVISAAIAEEMTKLNTKANLEPDDWLTRNEVAKLLGLSLPSISKYTRNGALKGFRIGRNIRYKRKEVIAAMQQINTIKYSPKK